MRIEYPLGIPPKHPIQEFKFSTSLQTIEIGDHSLRLSTIEDLEPAIDQVFEWLSLNALPQSEMENLAPFFGKLWPSAIALAEKLAAIFKRSSSNRQNLIELGCGLGLPGLIAKKFGVEATLTDNHPCVPSFLEKNLAYNDIDSVKYFLLSSLSQMNQNNKFDFIVGSDILYESYHPKYFASICTFLAHQNTKVIVTDPGRPYIQNFVNHMKGDGWVEILEPWTVPFKGVPSDVYLLRFERNQ